MLLNQEDPELLADWYTEAELEVAPSILSKKAEHLAGRMAAKEAIAKALGTGLTGNMVWQEIEIISSGVGKPELILHGATREVEIKLGITQWLLSISHTEQYGFASAICVGT